MNIEATIVNDHIGKRKIVIMITDIRIIEVIVRFTIG